MKRAIWILLIAATGCARTFEMEATASSWSQTVTGLQSCIETDRGVADASRYTIIEASEHDAVGERLSSVLRARLPDEPILHWRASEPDDSDTTTAGYVMLGVGGGLTALASLFAVISVSTSGATVPDWVLGGGAGGLGLLLLGGVFTLISTWAYGEAAPRTPVSLRGPAACRH